MDTYYARLTWNQHQWRHPSGLIARTEKGTYVAHRRFGHEEWLNRTEWMFDGWRYGYVEGIGRSPRLIGKRVRLVLFSINARRDKVFVGEVRTAEVLNNQQAAAALREFRRQGWIATMIRELEDRIGVRLAKGFRRDVTGAGAVMNIRFRPQALRIFPAPVPVPSNHPLRKFDRYGLMGASSSSEKLYRRKSRKAMLGLRASEVAVRRAVPAVKVDPVESRMENEVRQLLVKRFGDHAVAAQLDFVDLTVKDGDTTFLIELKSSLEARSAIRQALGQLLDYAFFKEGRAIYRLVAIGQGPLGPAEARFLRTLRDRFNIPIDYRRYVVGSMQFRL